MHKSRKPISEPPKSQNEFNEGEERVEQLEKNLGEVLGAVPEAQDVADVSVPACNAAQETEVEAKRTFSNLSI